MNDYDIIIVGMATTRPNAVVYNAIAIPRVRTFCFWLASTSATALNAMMMPKIVPSRPSKVATLAITCR